VATLSERRRDGRWIAGCREQPMKASSLRWQMQQRMDEITEHVEIIGDKD
jgi:hypothetical protein